jgi:CheY-like chemotaxis protein
MLQEPDPGLTANRLADCPNGWCARLSLNRHTGPYNVAVESRMNGMSALQANVLVVDDEPAIREMIAFALQRQGLGVQLASDAHEALLAINNQRPDIILLDWMMPGVSGLELTRRLRRDNLTQDIPIIMLTAKVSEDD